jgi:hypothetical protein
MVPDLDRQRIAATALVQAREAQAAANQTLH